MTANTFSKAVETSGWIKQRRDSVRRLSEAKRTNSQRDTAAALIIGLTLLCSADFARADWNIGAEFRIAHVPVSAGVDIVEQFSEERTTPDAMAALAALIQNGGATVVTELFGSAVDGAQLVVEGTEEFRYPTAHEPPNPQLAPKPASGLAIPAPPSTMEIKDVGVTLQCEMNVSADGMFFSGAVRCRNVRHLGNLRYEYGVRADGLKYFVEQPKFAVRGTTANVVVKSGMPTLMGCYLPPELPGQMELHIVTVKSSQVGESKPDDGDARFQWRTRLDVRRYRLAVEDGIGARVSMNRGDNGPEAVLQKLMHEGKAVISMCASKPSIPGHQDAFDDILEIRYPAEFDLSGFWYPKAELDRELRLAATRARKNARDFFDAPRPYRYPAYLPTVPPTTFEFRNTGSVVQSEIGEVREMDSAVMINLAVQEVSWNGFKCRLKAIEPQGERVYDYQPNFTTRKTTENRALPVGKVSG